MLVALFNAKVVLIQNEERMKRKSSQHIMNRSQMHLKTKRIIKGSLSSGSSWHDKSEDTKR